MKNDFIKKNYLEKIKKIQKHNKLYYNSNRPIISDQEYDKLKNEVLDLENKYSFLINKKSPSKSVGYKPSKNFTKVKHKVPMLSLGNAFNEVDLENGQNNLENDLENNIKYVNTRDSTSTTNNSEISLSINNVKEHVV